MLTEIRSLRTVCLIGALLVSLSLSAQDTLKTRLFERYWTKPRIVPKLGLGLQETGFVEVGVQWHKIFVHPLSLASAGPYLTVDGLIDDKSVIIGPKLGYEISAGLFGIAADMTWYTNFDRDALVVTPRAGISIMGFVNLFYGRNIGVSDFQFPAIDKNRFSLIFSLNRDYFNVRDAPRKR